MAALLSFYDHFFAACELCFAVIGPDLLIPLCHFSFSRTFKTSDLQDLWGKILPKTNGCEETGNSPVSSQPVFT